MCSDSRSLVNPSPMSVNSPTHANLSCDGVELYRDCDTAEGVTFDQHQPEESSRTLFFARCPPTLPDHELLQLFGEFGQVTSFNLYRRWAKAKNSKGCGTVVYADKASAAAALARLDGKQAWPESETPMVVEWAQPSKIRQPAPTNDAAGPKQGSQGQFSKPLPLTGGRAITPPGSSSSSSGSLLMGSQQPSKPLALLKAKPYSSASASSASSNHSIATSHRLLQEALTVQTALMDCNSFGAMSPLSEHEAQFATLPHELPRLGSLVLDLTPAINIVPGTPQASTPAIFMRPRPVWADSTSLLPHISPSNMHGSCGSITSQSIVGEQGYHSNSVSMASVSDSIHSWSNQSNTAPTMLPTMHMHDGGILQQQRACSAAAAAAAAIHPMPGPLLQGAGSAGAAAAAAMQFSPCLWPNLEQSSSLLPSAEHAFDNSECGGSFAAAVAAAATSHGTSGLAQNSCSSSSTVPCLLELMPAMSWLQLQQIDQQSAFNSIAAAAAAAVNPTCHSSASFAGSAGSGAFAGRPATTAASMQEVHLDLNHHAANIVVSNMDLVKNKTGADVIVKCSGAGLQLRLRGSLSQIESACGILRVLLL